MLMNNLIWRKHRRKIGSPDGMFPEFFGFICCIHLVKGPQKAFGKGMQNLECDYHMQADQSALQCCFFVLLVWKCHPVLRNRLCSSFHTYLYSSGHCLQHAVASSCWSFGVFFRTTLNSRFSFSYVPLLYMKGNLIGYGINRKLRPIESTCYRKLASWMS